LPDGRSLLSGAFERACALRNTPGVLLVTNRDYAFQCLDEFAAFGAQLSLHSILEPVGRTKPRA
jgi:mannose-1-phosphate guanylyltransferase